MPSFLVDHGEQPVSKRRKLSAAHDAGKLQTPWIFAPYRVRDMLSCNRILSNVRDLIDSRSGLVYRCAVHFHPLGQNHLPNHHICRKMSAHLRPPERAQSHVRYTAPDTRRYHRNLCMEGSCICSMGRRGGRGRVGSLGFQEREADSGT